MFTTLPPPSGPTLGLTEDTIGAASYVEALGWLPVPPAVVTETVVEPAAPAGTDAEICVALMMVKPEDGLAPKSTTVAPRKFVPLTMTMLPPPSGPKAGLTLDTVGAGT